jgi:hypothetical protein
MSPTGPEVALAGRRARSEINAKGQSMRKLRMMIDWIRKLFVALVSSWPAGEPAGAADKDPGDWRGPMAPPWAARWNWK